MTHVNDDRLYSVLPSNNDSTYLTIVGLSRLYCKTTGESVTDADMRKGLARLLKSGRAEEGVVTKDVFGVKVSYPAFRKAGHGADAQIPSSDARQSQAERDIADVVASAPREFEPDDDPPF